MTAETISASGRTRPPTYGPSIKMATRSHGSRNPPKSTSRTARRRQQSDLLPDRPGAPTMLQPGDEEWLREKHPGLTVAGEILSGSIQFRAGYDAKINQFFSIEEGATASTDAVILSGTFKVRIKPRADRSNSRLPSLYVHGIEPAANRHFNSADKSACLCSPLEEDEFLRPELQFRVFLEQLVIPFLYGQVY